MKARTFDRKFDAGEKVVDQLDFAKARRKGAAPDRVNRSPTSPSDSTAPHPSHRTGATPRGRP